METAGTAVVEGGWGRDVCPPVEPRSHGLGALRPAAGGISRWHTWPWLQPVPLVPAESRCIPRCHGGHAPPSPAGSGHRGRRGTRTAASVPHPAKCSRIPPARHHFSPTGCFSSCPRFSRGKETAPCLVRTGPREAAEEKGQNQKTKNHPQPWGAQLQQRRLFPGQGKTRAKGQNSDVPPRRAPLPPPGGGARGRGTEPGGAGGGRGAEPGRGPVSRGAFSALVRPSQASALLRRSFSRGLRMVPSPCSFLPLSPVCSPTGGVWVSARPQELRPLWPGTVDLSEKSPK